MEKELIELRQELDAKRRKRAELEGRREQLLSDLSAKFGVDTLEAAKTLLKRLESQNSKEGKALRRKLAQFKSTYGGRL